MIERRLISVEGVVQGVGFRPHVHRLAATRKLRGTVRNESAKVVVDVEGEGAELDEFCQALINDPPGHARIERTLIEVAAPGAYHDFRITVSRSEARRSIAPAVPFDVATCDACVGELFDPANRRFEYPFITCTVCGPRFTILRELPYDRQRTTMAAFALCELCQREYDDPADRRFHAETISCPHCGPTLSAARSSSESPVIGPVALRAAIEALRGGEIVALKALGGYHLACDATCGATVARLRARKRRATKPFAVMVPSLTSADALCRLSRAERELLASASRPIVLLPRRNDAPVVDGVAPQQCTLGVMLPSTPLHHLLLAALDRPLVMTSGNRSDEPVAITEAEAFATLGGIADLFLTHDRPIAARCDDSVVRIVAGDVRSVRRSRGRVPNATPLAPAVREPVLALGGHLKNTVCIACGGYAILSAHVGDLESWPAQLALRDAIDGMIRVASVTPRVVAHDLHPEYASTRLADLLVAEWKLNQRVAVQHHHAHVAACIAEHGVKEPVIGVAFDGTGLGTDGAIWGGEFLVVDGARFERRGHLSYVPLPGADAVARRPWRSALAHLSDAGCGDGFACPPEIDRHEWEAARHLTSASTGASRTSSVGRLFDAVASLLGICHEAHFEGEAAMALETIVDRTSTRRYPVRMHGDDCWQIDAGEIIRGVVHDRSRGRPVEEIAAAFHNTVVAAVVEGCDRTRAETGLGTVVLTGGVFMNAVLLTRAAESLGAREFRVLLPRDVPCNDGGLSLGQAWVAARAIEEEACA